MVKKRALGILLALALSLGCLGTLGFASAESEKVTGFNIGTIEDAGDDYYVKIFFQDEVLSGGWVTEQYSVLKDKISVNGKKLSEIFASAQFGNVHWVDDGGANSSHLRIQFMKQSGDNLYGDGILNTDPAETNTIVLEEGIEAPSGVLLPGLSLTLNGVGGTAVDSSMTDRYTQTGVTPPEPTAPEHLVFDIGAIGGTETDYYLKLFFKGDLLVNNTAVTNQFESLKDKISVNGEKLADILTPRQFGNVHWTTENGSHILRIDFMKGSEGNPDGDGVLKEGLNTVELEQGIVAPNGNILPKLKVWLNKDGTPTSSLNTPGLVREAVQEDTPAGTLTVKNVTGIEEADNGENYAFNIIFNEKVTEGMVINQWNNFYLCDKIKVNGWTLEEIFGSETPNAVNAHWFVADGYSDGYLRITMKTAMIDDCAIKNDGSDVVELLPGLRSNTNLELKTGVRLVFDGTSWVGDTATVAEIAVSNGVSGSKFVDLTFDRACATDGNFEDAEIDLTKFTLNGKALPAGTAAAYVKSGENYVLRLTLPAGALADGTNTLTVGEGFELANGYRIKAAQTKDVFVKAVSSITVTAPTKTQYELGETLDIAGAKLTITFNDESTETVDVTSAMISGYDADKAGEQTVTVTYEGKTATFKVTVKEKAPEPTGCACGTISGGTFGGGMLLFAACAAILLLFRRRKAV